MEIYIMILAYCGIFFVFLEIGKETAEFIKFIKNKRNKRKDKDNVN